MKGRVDWLISQMEIVGGAETFVREAAPLLRARGWDLRLVALSGGGVLLAELQAAGVPVVALGAHHKADLRALLRLGRLWRSDRPCIVHTHLYHAGLAGRLVARLLGIALVVVHQQGPEWSRARLRSLLDRRTAAWVTRYAVSCQAVAAVLQSRERIPPSQIEVIYAGVRLPDGPPGGRPPEWPVPSGVPALACVGRFAPEKGQTVLLDALARLDAAGVNAHTIFLGDGPLRSELARRAGELGLDEKVTFAGLRRDVRLWLPHCDLFVLPSDWEGISLALLEAMAAGLPAVATAAGGTPEAVAHGRTGLLVPPRDPDALAAALARLLADAALRQEMGRAARARAAQRFALEQVVLDIDRLYERLLAGESEVR